MSDAHRNVEAVSDQKRFGKKTELKSIDPVMFESVAVEAILRKA